MAKSIRCDAALARNCHSGATITDFDFLISSIGLSSAYCHRRLKAETPKNTMLRRANFETSAIIQYPDYYLGNLVGCGI
jgi:hypothetical protein